MPVSCGRAKPTAGLLATAPLLPCALFDERHTRSIADLLLAPELVRGGLPVSAVKSRAKSRFDAAYYRRHYQDPRTAVTSRPEVARRAAYIGAFLRHMDLPVRTILDAG